LKPKEVRVWFGLDAKKLGKPFSPREIFTSVSPFGFIPQNNKYFTTYKEEVTLADDISVSLPVFRTI
jgi:hypothetical protein